MKPLTVSLIEDEPASARLHEDLLSQAREITFLRHYRTAEEALLDLPAHCPRVLLVDLELPGMGGVDCIRRLKRILPDLLCLVLTQFDDSDRCFAAIQAGADGYVLKRTGAARLLEAIFTVDQGGGFMSPSICRHMLDFFHRLPPTPHAQAALSPREIDLLQLARRGRQPKEIAVALDLSYETVRTHFRNIYRKLHVHSFAEAVDKTFRQADPPDPGQRPS